MAERVLFWHVNYYCRYGAMGDSWFEYLLKLWIQTGAFRRFFKDVLTERNVAKERLGRNFVLKICTVLRHNFMHSWFVYSSNASLRPDLESTLHD